MMMKLTQTIRIPLALFLLVGTGCQQSFKDNQQKIVPMNVQLEQLASVVAGTNISNTNASAVICLLIMPFSRLQSVRQNNGDGIR